jgi:hypothetical protein
MSSSAVRWLSRQAAAQGYRLHRPRCAQGYWLIDCDSGEFVLGGVHRGVELDEVEAWLDEREASGGQ